MPGLGADEIVTYRHKRIFIQFGGAEPNNPTKYYGQDAQYMEITGVSLPELGGIDPMYFHDPSRTGKYRLVSRTLSPPDLATATLNLYEKHGAIPKQLMDGFGCFNLYVPTGPCADLSDFLTGWSDYVEIYENGLVTDRDLGDRFVVDSDEAVKDALNTTFSAIYPIGAFAFGEGAAAQVDREVVDIVYGKPNNCDDCQDPDSLTDWIYALTKSSGAGSPGLPAEVVYTVNGGGTWHETSITGLGSTVDGLAIDIVGPYLVVVVGAENAYYYSTINSKTGVPGTWTKVTSGFVAGKTPTDIFVNSPREIYFSALGGYVYKSTDITSGVEVINNAGTTSNDLLRISGRDETIVAVGKASTVIISQNRGQTFATATATVSAIPLDVTAVGVKSSDEFWVGTSLSGRVFYTLTGGESWVQKTFSGAGAGNVRDIVIVTGSVIHFAHDDNTPTGRIFTSWDGGYSFTNTARRILNLPTHSRTNRIAVPPAGPAVASNNIALAGLSGGGTDGVIYIGVAATF